MQGKRDSCEPVMPVSIDGASMHASINDAWHVCMYCVLKGPLVGPLAVTYLGTYKPATSVVLVANQARDHLNQLAAGCFDLGATLQDCCWLVDRTRSAFCFLVQYSA